MLSLGLLSEKSVYGCKVHAALFRLVWKPYSTASSAFVLLSGYFTCHEQESITEILKKCRNVFEGHS